LPTFVDIARHALTITSFVFVMMLVIEYINVQTAGAWQSTLRRSPAKQYALAALLGALPGCLGAFTVVSLYAHRSVTFGALVAATIATSGDEAFVMFAMFPGRALLLTVVLAAIGWLAGFATDRLFPGKREAGTPPAGHELELHGSESCECFEWYEVTRQLKEISFHRALILGLLIAVLFTLFEGSIGPQSWNWTKLTLLAGVLFALFVVATVPDHFLQEHLWEHILKKHLMSVFAWTLGALLAIHALGTFLDIESWIEGNFALALVVASLAGLLPQSGPHLVFVTLFARGAAPFSILLANSIVQDGHGTLPLLALSKRAFIRVKIVNLVVGLGVGALVMLFEYFHSP